MRAVGSAGAAATRRAVLLALLIGTVLVVAVLGPAAPAGAQTAGPQVVVVGVAGLRWDDVGVDTPTLARLVGQAAVGALSVKTPEAVTCPADGWLTLGAGARASSAQVDRDPCTADLPPADDRDRTRNADAVDEADVGALARALGGLEQQGPGAVLAGGPGSDGRVRLVDAGTLDDVDRPAGRRRVDAALAEAEQARPAGADLIVVGLSGSPGEDRARLHLALATGPSFERGALRSPSTRRDGYVQLIDVAPTVLALIGVPVPPEMDGQPMTARGPAPAVTALVDRDARAVEGKRATVPFFVVLIAAQVLLALVLWRRPRALQRAMVTGVAAVGASYAAMLVPWWRTGAPLLALLAVALGLAVVVSTLAMRTRHPVGWTCAAVTLLLVVDLVTGAHLQLESPAGYSSLVAGRFAGIGNVAFGVYGATALLATAGLAGGRPVRRTSGLVVACGVVAVAVDGAPPWGSDVGGVLALLPAFVVLGMLLTGTRVSVVRLLLAGFAGAVVVTAFALADYSRPSQSRTHLGRFVAQVRDGTAGEVLTRKAEAIGNLLFGNPVTALLPLVVAGVVYVFLRPPASLRRAFVAEPALRQGLLAVGLLAALGFAVNDSGPAVVALAILVALPATLAVQGGVAAGPGPARPT